MNRLIVFFSLLIASCAQCPPTPTPPPSQLDAAPVADTSPTPAVDAFPDPFAGRLFDCTGLDTKIEQVYASTCADKGGNMTACLLAHVSDGVGIGILACGARDAEMAALVFVDNGSASPTIKNRATILRSWFANENLTLRSAP